MDRRNLERMDETLDMGPFFVERCTPNCGNKRWHCASVGFVNFRHVLCKCLQHLPAFFFNDFGDRFQKFVVLQGPSAQEWPVNLYAAGAPRAGLRLGFREGGKNCQ
jgi:hypothetical protein